MLGAQGGFTTFPLVCGKNVRVPFKRRDFIYVKVGMNVHSGKTIPFAMREGISQMLLVEGGGVEVGE